MPQTGFCTDVFCSKELTELYECHCCSWLICLKHLLEHVEVSKRDKQSQLDGLRNELMSTACALELIVDRKILEIEGEKQLVNQAKTILQQSDCTIEEIQSISKEINQAIISNRKEETIVKVESSLLDIKTCLCNADMTTDTLPSPNFYSSSSSNHTLQQPNSPTYLNVRPRMSVLENSSTPKNRNDRSKNDNHGCSIRSMDVENVTPEEEKSANEEDNEGHATKRKCVSFVCPFTFDGAFGLTKEKHSIHLCSPGHVVRGNLVGHIMLAHKLPRVYARRVYKAVQYRKDPKTTKLFEENEVVISSGHRILCPFNNSTINLIGCCPTKPQKVPCQFKPIENLYLVAHLRGHHKLPIDIAREVADNYRETLSRKTLSTTDDVSSR